MRDPFQPGDPTGIRDWLRSKGHDVREPSDLTNHWNRPTPKCANPECDVLLVDSLPGAKYHSRKCKEAHTVLKRRGEIYSRQGNQAAEGIPSDT